MLRKIIPFAVAVVGLLGLTAWYRHPISAWDEEADTDSPEDIHSTRIRQFLPKAEFAGEVSTIIHAPPSAIFSAIHSVTVDDMPIAKWIGQLRYLPGLLLGKAQTLPKTTETPPFIDQLQEGNTNIILAKIQDQELILGAIGKFHQIVDQEFVPLQSAAEFIAFEQPEYQKLAMSFFIHLLPDRSASRLVLVHGTHALSDEARRRFALYWLGIKPGGNLVTWLLLRAIKAIAEQGSPIATSERDTMFFEALAPE